MKQQDGQPETPFHTVPGQRFQESKWIWARNSRKVNGHLLFRTQFEVEDLSGESWLFLAVESMARVFLNGREVLRTSSLSYPGQHYCESASLEAALTRGTNEIAVLAWYIGVPSGASCPKDPGLLAEIVHDDGTLLSASGEDWKVCPLDAWEGQYRRSRWLNLDLIEILDFGKLMEAFPMVPVTEAFSTPEANRYPGARYISVEPRTFAKPCGKRLSPLRIHEQGFVVDHSAEYIIPALAVHAERIEAMSLGIDDTSSFQLSPTPEGKAWSLVVDLESYEKGLPRMRASGDPGTVIDISWFEHIDTPRAWEKLTEVHATDRFILSGKTDDLIPEEWKCGRYLQLTFRNIKTTLQVENLCWEQLHFPLRKRSTLKSSSKKLERIMEISLRAAALCMHDNIMDCPWRERRQWIGDVQRIALINYYGFGEYALPRAVLRQQVRLQDISGRMWVCLPVNEEMPSQSMEWLRAVLEYQQYSGDSSLVEELADNVEWLHRWFLRCRDSRGLFFLDKHPAINWMDNTYGSVLSNDSSIRQFQFETPFLALNLRYLLFLEDVRQSMEQVNRPELAAEAQRERNRIASILCDHFHEPDTGLFRDSADKRVPLSFSEMGHALAIRCSLPGIDNAGLWETFQKFAGEHPDRIIRATPFGKYHTHEALGKLGKPGAILEDILQHWGPMVDAGADTTWEWFHADNSHCHGWAGIPVVSVMRHVLNLEPGSREDKTARDLAGVDWIQGKWFPEH